MAENYITCQDEKGSINISEDVISNVARAAVTEVEGVAGLSYTAGAELAEMIGLKTVSKGVKVQFVDGAMTVDVIITVKYGNNILDTAKAVQEKIFTVVQATTGFEDVTVNVHVSGISLEK